MDSSTREHPVALVTGASSGIGREVARRLARRGYATVLIARRAERLRQLADELQALAPSTALPLDLSDTKALACGLDRLEHEHPVIDVLVNNAGFGDYESMLEQSMEMHRRLFEVNYFASVEFIRSVLPGMLERRGGHVINIASIASKFGPWGHGAYAGAKAALVALTQSLACEYSERGIHFSYVNPGVVKTEFFDRPSYQPMARQVARHAVAATRVADRIVGLLDRPRLELCVPGYYRVLDYFRDLSPKATWRLVAVNSKPRS